MQPYTSVKFSIVTIMMAYIIKLNQLSSYIQALVLVCYILMVYQMASPTAAAHMVVSAPWISATVAVPLPAWLAGYLA